MKKAAVIFANGCEEGEALTIVDILRRAELHCDMVGLDSEITGAHGVTMRMDNVLGDEVKDYDMIILPGGYAGTENMMNSAKLLEIIKDMNEAGKWVTAMCAAPRALDVAGVLEGKKFTCYPTQAEFIKSGTYTTENKVIVDGNLITSVAPATAYAFAYKLVDALGGDSLTVKKRMVYFNAFDVKEDE